MVRIGAPDIYGTHRIEVGSAPGPGIPGQADGDIGRKDATGTFCHLLGNLGRDLGVALEGVLGHTEHRMLDLVDVSNRSPAQNARCARYACNRGGNHPGRARFRRRNGQLARRARVHESGRAFPKGAVQSFFGHTIPYEKITSRLFQRYWTPETTVSTTAATISTWEIMSSTIEIGLTPAEAVSAENANVNR